MTIQLAAKRFIPPGAVKVADKKSDAIAYIYATADGAPAAIGFHGRATKPDFWHRFSSETARERRILDHFNRHRAWAARKAAAAAAVKAERAKGHGLQVGHVLKASWGYEQTNVDFFQVVELVGKCSVRLRPISGNITGHDGHMSGHTIPAIDGFKGPAILRRIGAGGSVRVDDCRWASLWDGKPVRWSAYH